MSFLTIAIDRFQRPQRVLFRATRELELDLPDALDHIGFQILQRIRHNLSGVVLNKRSGRLFNSYDYKVEEIVKGQVWTMSTGSAVVYARIHDTGGMAGRNHASRIPKRPYHIKAWVEKKSLIKRHTKKFVANLLR